MPKQGRNRGQISAEGQTALVAATHVALGAGWGASTKTITANDVCGQVVITAVTGGGLAQATATITVTFASPYATAPRLCIATMTNTNDLATNGPVAWSCTTTALTLTQQTIPVNGGVYTINYLLVA